MPKARVFSLPVPEACCKLSHVYGSCSDNTAFPLRFALWHVPVEVVRALHRREPCSGRLDAAWHRPREPRHDESPRPCPSRQRCAAVVRPRAWL